MFPSDAADRALVDATETWRLIDDLIAHGYSKAFLARELGYVAPHVLIGRDRCEARNARRVK